MDIEFFYELVDKQAREEVNLMEQKGNIARCVAHAFPEATKIAVFGNFYGFSLPAGAVFDCSSRLRQLGRLLAARMPALCGLAMCRYEPKDHPPSNQLFRRVKGKKRLLSYREQYADA